MHPDGWEGCCRARRLDGDLRAVVEGTADGAARRLDRLDGVGGLYSVVHLDAAGRGFVASDPLGVMPTYIGHRRDGGVVVANNPRLVERATDDGTGRRGRDIDTVGWILAIGYGFGNGSGFEGVERVAPSRYVRIDAGAKVAIGERTWLSIPTRRLEQDELAAAVTAIRTQLVHNIHRTAALPGEQVVGLTGGRDTRLVLAAARVAGVAHQFRYETMGQLDLPDVIVAEQLAKRFGLDHRVVGGDRAATSPDWLLRRLRETTFVSCGTVPGKELRLPARLAERAFVSGELGEGYRTTEASQRSIRTEDDLDQYLQARLLNHDRGGLVKPAVEREYLARFRARVIGHTASTIDLGDALHLAFLEKMIVNRLGSHELLNGLAPRLYPASPSPTGRTRPKRERRRPRAPSTQIDRSSPPPRRSPA
jgi:hypothetical protein